MGGPRGGCELARSNTALLHSLIPCGHPRGWPRGLDADSQRVKGRPGEPVPGGSRVQCVLSAGAGAINENTLDANGRLT
jgi:hypothetical protein